MITKAWRWLSAEQRRVVERAERVTTAHDLAYALDRLALHRGSRQRDSEAAFRDVRTAEVAVLAENAVAGRRVEEDDSIPRNVKPRRSPTASLSSAFTFATSELGPP
jgi:hypothetical protein